MKKISEIQKLFLEQAKKQKRKIGITILRPIDETMRSLKRASKFADLIVVGARVNGFVNIIEKDQDKVSQILISLLKEKKVDGIVRGQVKDSYTLDEFFRQFGREPIPSNRKICPIVLRKRDYTLVVSTCSVYHALTFEDKIYEAERVIKYMKEDLGLEPKIAVMGILRPTSKRGKYKILDEITERCTKLYQHLVDNGYEVKEYFMEFETAVWDKCNLIVPSIGFVGNSWVKSLMYLGDWQIICCPYLDLGVAYEDGTRNEKDFYWHIVHAVAMVNSKKS